MPASQEGDDRDREGSDGPAHRRTPVTEFRRYDARMPALSRCRLEELELDLDWFSRRWIDPTRAAVMEQLFVFAPCNAAGH